MGVTTTHKFQGDSNWMRSFSEIGEGTIVSASDDNTVRFWSLRDAECKQTVSCHGFYVRDVVILNDKTVMTASLDSTAKVVRVADGQVLAYCTFSYPLWSCAALNTNTVVVGDEKGNIFKLKWDFGDLTIVNQMDEAHKDEITEIYAYGDTFATCSVDKTVKLWEGMSLALLHTFEGHDDSVYSVTYDDMYFCTSSKDNTIRVYDARNFEWITTIETHSNTVNCVRIATGTNIVVSGGWDKVIALHALPSGDCINKYNIGMYVTSVTLLASGQVAVGGSRPCAVHVLNVPELSSSSSTDSETTITKTTSIPGIEGIKPVVNNEHKSLSKNHELIARKQFEMTAGDATALLTVDDATEAANLVLKSVGVRKTVDVDEFEDIFIEISNDVKVNMDKFVEVMLHIMRESEQHLEHEYEVIFKSNVKGRESVRVPFATRMLYHGCKELKERKIVGDRQLTDEKVMRVEMAKFARKSDGRIDREAFVNAALFIIHDIQRNIPARKNVTTSKVGSTSQNSIASNRSRNKYGV